MTVEEIFNALAAHMHKGIQFHDEMAQAYEYLSLFGFSKCHISHACTEKIEYLQLSHYYMTHYFKLLQFEETTDTKLIPETWYKYTTQVVDGSTKRNAVKELMTKWVKWEQDTKKLYQDMRQELIQLGEVAAALYIDQYICDVTKELCHAQKKLIKLETLGYDLNSIIEWQEKLYKKYKKKLGW